MPGALLKVSLASEQIPFWQFKGVKSIRQKEKFNQQ